MADTSLAIFQPFLKEIHCDEDGHGSVTRRGVARLVDASEKSIRVLLKKVEEGAEQTLPKMLGSFAGTVLDSASPIPDLYAAAIIKYYAYQGKQKAQEVDILLSAFGLRKLIQDVTGYKAPIRPKLTAQEIIELCCLPAPTVWQKRFPEEYYQHLSRLTGLVVEGIERPMLFAKLTKELVYDYLPTGIYTEVKRCQAETGSWDKLHQFLSDDGVLILETHQRRVLEHMQGAASLEQLRTSLRQACTGQYQLVLLGG
ncbi:MAG: P63C domain-containing protein [Microcoleus sp.]